MFIVYKTTNLETNQFYIGSHKLSTLDDKYFYWGSGVELNKQLKQYPVTAFKREILFECNSSEEALFLEREIILQNRNDPLCLNRSNGGRNFEHINSIKGLNNKANNCSIAGQACSRKLREDPEFAKEQSKKISEGLTPEIRAQISAKNKGNKYSLGYHHTEENKKKIGAITSVAQRGSGNSQYGTFWITNGVENKKWRNSYGDIPEGFHKGRIINKES